MTRWWFCAIAVAFVAINLLTACNSTRLSFLFDIIFSVLSVLQYTMNKLVVREIGYFKNDEIFTAFLKTVATATFILFLHWAWFLPVYQRLALSTQLCSVERSQGLPSEFIYPASFAPIAVALNSITCAVWLRQAQWSHWQITSANTAFGIVDKVTMMVIECRIGNAAFHLVTIV